ncbi:MAG: heme exporter protein CcmB [Rhodospirillaceae bacterium]|nr:heme exporter protein CcmB [Rhodospirillaceae bacterium]MBT5240482.1 heme exporter protein CcmB [Rhodospirillaceae bacterium]MBT5564953.1 heme exporter protein CcmB [Rhodospirillaceae bacterium]MBT6090505.1 heme exporter protein CcmB [Rhodospirillaceae bacterium]MBT6961837.1 heme exporter protein CcmB [Rhodospirillaceae bacterium]
MSAFFILIGRDLQLSIRHRADTIMVAGFFAITVILFPFGIGPEPGVLERVGAGILWVTALLASLLSLDHLFSDDEQDGALDLLLTAPVAPTTVVAAKIAAHWLTTGLPLTLLAPILGVALQMPSESTVPMITALLIGTPTLSLIGAVGAALTLGARRRGILLPLVILPLYIPILIFGVGAIDTSGMGFEAGGLFAVLGGFLLIALALCPWAAAVSLRVATE